MAMWHRHLGLRISSNFSSVRYSYVDATGIILGYNSVILSNSSRGEGKIEFENRLPTRIPGQGRG